MGEIAEMMLNGTLCACCGEYLGAEDEGYPQYHGGCEPGFLEEERAKQKRKTTKKAEKVNCPHCGKRVKLLGLVQHIQDKHIGDTNAD